MDWSKYLPKMLAGEELKKALMDFPEYTDSIRGEDAATRLIQLSNLYKIYYPSKMSMEIYTKLYLALIMSLKKKNTRLFVQQQKENSFGMRTKEYRGIIGGSDSASIIGISGVGKSSAIARSIELITDNRIIELDEPFVKIVPILQVQCPFDASPKGMLLEILRTADENLGSSYYRSGTRTGVTTDVLIGLVAQVCLNHLGVLVIDEIQHVIKHRNGHLLIGVLMQLINCSGVSVFLVGTPECTQFFESEMQLARRSLGLKYSELSYDEYFVEFCRLLFEFQYTKEKAELTDGIIAWLYEHSGGVTANVVTLVHDTQEVAIINGSERMDIANFNEAYNSRMGMLHSKIVIDKVKKSPVKKKCKTEIASVELPELKDISIENIINEAKDKGIDVVKCLRQYVSVQEVSV